MQQATSDRRNRRKHSDQNGQRQKPTQENRHLVHAALLNTELAVHRALRDEGLPRVTELPGYSERLTEPVTEADPTEKYGSDAHLIRFGHGLVFRSTHNGS
ncbi:MULTISPECIES: hypothetical protein [unclassified Pseudomonas]|uniref:hypothetical protein n=1 Tax=unclassified Pseudomonas TaxID=196821 RepID=UPI001314DCF5|nr:hypothetical protein [Pseudomonas sp. MWU12-2020]